MYAWTIIVGLLVAVNISAALLGGLGKKSLRRSLARLEKLREDRVARLKVLKKRRKSMDGTRNFMRRRRDDLKRLVVEQEEKFERLEAGEEDGEFEEIADEESEMAIQEEGVGQVGDGEEKQITSWMDKKDGVDNENMWKEERKIRTRFSAEKEDEGNL